MAGQQERGLRRLINATVFSWRGLKEAWRHEEAFRQEALLALIGVPLALWLGDTGVQRAVMIGSLLLVIIVELLNSAVEAVVDRIGTEIHHLSGRAKDMGSAAVLFSLINAGVIWLLVLLG